MCENRAPKVFPRDKHGANAIFNSSSTMNSTRTGTTHASSRPVASFCVRPGLSRGLLQFFRKNTRRGRESRLEHDHKRPNPIEVAPIRRILSNLPNCGPRSGLPLLHLSSTIRNGVKPGEYWFLRDFAESSRSCFLKFSAARLIFRYVSLSGLLAVENECIYFLTFSNLRVSRFLSACFLS